jgi:hypothetical protein
MNDERGTMNDEVKAIRFQFIVHRSALIVSSPRFRALRDRN